MHLLKPLLKSINSPYKDFWLRLFVSVVAGHLIVSHGFGFFKVVLLPNYFISLLGSSIIAFILFTVVNLISVQLDRHLAWRRRPKTRWLLQGTLGILLVVVLAYLLADQLFIYMDQKIEDSDYMTYDFYFICLYVLFINVYYYIYYRFQKKEELKAELSEYKKLHRNYAFKNAPPLLADVDLAAFDIAASTLACACWIDNSLHLYDMKGEFTLSTEKEEKVLEDLPMHDYVRLNRFCIVHRLLVLAWREASSRRVAVILRAPFNKLIPEDRKETSQGLTTPFIKAFENL